MHRFRSLWVLGMSAVMAVLLPACKQSAKDSSDSLSGKKIGLFANYKRAAMPIAKSLQQKLKAAYPDSEFSIYHSERWNVTEIETDNKEKFTNWVKGQDAVILMVGD